MKRTLTGLCFFALVGTGMAQIPMQQSSPYAPPVQPGMPLGNYQQLPAQGTITHNMQGSPVPADCCPPPVKTICVPEPAIKKITRVLYCNGCEEFCIPCLWGSCFHHGDCDGGHCEPPQTRYFLIKRVRIEECPTVKCTPVVVPACGAAPCVPPGEILPPPVKGK